jgi:hypothetical protein
MSWQRGTARVFSGGAGLPSETELVVASGELASFNIICARHETERAGETVWASTIRGGNRTEDYCAGADNSPGDRVNIGVTTF